MKPVQFILKDGQEEGIYPGIGVALTGQPITAYGAEQEQLLRDDARFKLYRGEDADGAAEGVSADATVAGEDTKPAAKKAKE